MNKKLKFILKTISNLLVFFFIILIFLLVGIKLFGFELYTVISGSMEPTHKVGSIVYVKKVTQEELKKDDVITYYLDDETLSTHRIVELIKNKDTKEIEYRTKGDANDSPDAQLVVYKDIKGKVIFSVPKLGYILTYIGTRVGKIVVISACITVSSLIVIIEILTEDKNKSQRRTKNEEKISYNHQ